MSSTASAKVSKNEELFNRAKKLYGEQRIQDAEKTLKKLVKNDPKHIDALLMLAEIQGDSGRPDVAMRNLVKILKQDSEHFLAWRHLGYMQLYVKGDMVNALDSLSRALQLNPNDAQIYGMMGFLSQQLNQHDDAIELFETGLQLSPANAMMLSYLGMSYMHQKRYDEAREFIFKGLSLRPDSLNFIINALKADEFLSLNENEKSILENSLNEYRKTGQQADYINLYEAKRLTEEKKYDEALKALASIEDNPNKQGFVKHFQIAKVYRAKGDVDKAFEHYKTGNDMQSRSLASLKFKKESLPQVITREHELLTDDFIDKVNEAIDRNKHERPYQDPTFLVGFPRSGTTLTGTILDHHPDLITADEYGAIDQIKIHFRPKFGLQVPGNIPDLKPEHWEYMYELYNEKQSNLPQEHKDKIFVDKMPLNITNMTLIYGMFPKSKILRVIRHPLDSVLSGYMQCFAPNAAMVHFNNIEDMAKLYRDIHELWKSYKTNLSIDYHEAKYENIVENFDDEVGGILDFIGVGWDDNVRNFNEEEEGAAGPKTLTPSRTQVSQGLYKGAQNRWKKYEKHLQPAIDILGDTIEELGYEL